MRLFTSNFFLTGESQQIGRVMDTITQLYFSHQDESNRILKSSDATYTFANAILILNTDLHNPKNEEKMSEDNFIKMCRKINDGDDLPLEVIKKTYSNIKKNKINTFRDRGNMIGISVSNWLNICTDYDSLSLVYYDSEMEVLD
jgi:Sec7-like guanine-nucleotide exchange factor